MYKFHYEKQKITQRYNIPGKNVFFGAKLQIHCKMFLVKLRRFHNNYYSPFSVKLNDHNFTDCINLHSGKQQMKSY